MGDRICRSSGAGIHQVALFYKYVAATRLGAFGRAGGFEVKPIESVCEREPLERILSEQTDWLVIRQ